MRHEFLWYSSSVEQLIGVEDAQVQSPLISRMGRRPIVVRGGGRLLNML